MRAFAAVSAVLLFLAGFVLYVFPADTDRFFAWTIRPTMTAMLMGAGYLAATVFFVRLLRETRWHRVALGFPAIIVFSACMTIATALHWDRFNHEHPAFWIWVVGYAVAPFLVAGLWLVNRRADAALELDDVVVPPVFRVLLVIGGIGAIALAVACIVAPSAIIPIWPWQLTPLTARVIGGWLSVPGLIALAIAIDGQWSSARYLVQCLILGLVLLLVAIGRVGTELDSGPGTSVIIVGTAAALGFSAALYVAMERRRRAIVGTVYPRRATT
jgi:hypothetical protein